jgi:CBS domain-containing protein
MEATARDAMTTAVLTLAPEMSLEDAVLALSARGVSGAPVCDPRGRPLGVVSKGDLAEWCVSPHGHSNGCVEDAMSTEVVSAAPDEPLRSVASRMVFEGAHRIVVLDAEGAVIGIITPLDVLRVSLDVTDFGAVHSPSQPHRFASWPTEDPTRRT